MINKAAELGPKQFPWWPDWRGECCAIIASGPSVRNIDVKKMRDRIHVIAIKENFDLFPWAEIVYGCDASWWIHRKGLPEYHGIKIAHGVQATSSYKDIHRVTIKNETDAMLVDQPLVIGTGGNSGHQSLNLAVQFGATDILLVGFDMAKGASENDLHWYGRNKYLNSSNPAASNFNRWLRGFDIAKKDTDRLGVNVINASPVSHIKCFKKADLYETLEEWGL